MGEAKPFEMLALSLINFSIPPKNTIADIQKKYGDDYISLQDNQIVCIKRGIKRIADVYSHIEERRRKQFNEKVNFDYGTHISQTLMLTGEISDFWTTPCAPTFLYISFLQTRDYAYIAENRTGKTRYEEIKECIGNNLSKMGCTADFALYYSYDFCDYVLFLKDIDLNSCNKLLWNLIMNKSLGLKYIRDSYTFFALRIKELAKKTKYGNNFKLGAVTLRLSFHTPQGFSLLKEHLISEQIPVTTALIFGRYDIELKTEELSLSQLCTLIRCLDKVIAESGEENYKGYAHIGGIEMTSVTSMEDITGDMERERNSNFVKAVDNELIKVILSVNGPGKNNFVFRHYINETTRSLRELLQSGFSTEFILGLFSPFVSAMENLKLTDENEDVNDNSNAQAIFNGLNTLAGCMMHGERRFIQAPSFSANYFDIPPKLYAFYQTIIQKVIKSYVKYSYVNCKETGRADKYQFLMIPDFRNGIIVKAIRTHSNEDTSKYLSLIYLSERFFYDPITALYLISQETAHYMSYRNRERRRECIFRVMSCMMMLAVFYPDEENMSRETLDNLYEAKSIHGVLAEQLKNMMREEYLSSSAEENGADSQSKNENKYLYVVKFLRNINYGFSLARQNGREKLYKRFLEALQTCREDEHEVHEYIEELQKDIFSGAEFLTNMLDENAGRPYVNRIFANNIINKIENLSENSLIEDYWCRYMDACEDILDAFRESFADYRMIQIMGNGFRAEKYRELLNLIVPQEENYHRSIREMAVLRAAANTTDPISFEESYPGFTDNSRYIAVRGIVDYLRECPMYDMDQHDRYLVR